jgi:uncharacterized membrane protein YfcA
LLCAAITKTGGSVVHGFAHSIEWTVVQRLATGSLPATVVTLTVLSLTNLESEAVRSLITLVLGGALLLTASVLIFRGRIVQFYRKRFPAIRGHAAASLTICVGAILGILVTVSSVGAGAVGVVALVILYPRLPMTRIVGSDIAHAVPLTLVAGLGHWMIGSIDWHVVGSLLAGSLPGIILGSCAAVRVPEMVLRLILAATLIVVAGQLLYGQAADNSSLLAAFTRYAPP